jgi:uncharacterized protein Smg (DUF494 family)
MNDDRASDPVRTLLSTIAEHLEAWLEGDERALEGLGDALQASGSSEDHVQAVILTLRSLAGRWPGAGVPVLDEPPGQTAQRVLSALERESLSPDAWGYLLGLRRRGALDAVQFECVLDRLASTGARSIGVDVAREVAARVALRPSGRRDSTAEGAGDAESSH